MSRRASLCGSLSALLPTSLQTSLLRACLLSSGPARQDWETWCRQVADPMKSLSEDGQSLRPLLPLILTTVRRNGLGVSAPLLTYLRAAYLREQLRSQAYRRICGHVISALTRHRIRIVVLRGAALADTVYRHPTLRHCHDIDVLVHPPDLAGAAQLLASLGFRRSRASRRPVPTVRLIHETGLPLALHGRLFQLPRYHVPFDDVWARGQTRLIADVPARIPSSADQLLHVCGHASYSPGRESLRWVCDAWSILEHDPAIDWEVFLRTAESARLALPLSVMLDYLADELHAPVDPPLLDRLRDIASRADTADTDAALIGVGMGSRRGLWQVLSLTRSWRARATLTKLILFPPRGPLWRRLHVGCSSLLGHIRRRPDGAVRAGMSSTGRR